MVVFRFQWYLLVITFVNRYVYWSWIFFEEGWLQVVDCDLRRFIQSVYNELARRNADMSLNHLPCYRSYHIRCPNLIAPPPTAQESLLLDHSCSFWSVLGWLLLLWTMRHSFYSVIFLSFFCFTNPVFFGSIFSSIFGEIVCFLCLCYHKFRSAFLVMFCRPSVLSPRSSVSSPGFAAFIVNVSISHIRDRRFNIRCNNEFISYTWTLQGLSSGSARIRKASFSWPRLQ